MADLYVGMVILAGACLLAGGISGCVAPRLGRYVYLSMLAGMVGITTVFAMTVHGQLTMAQWLPYSNAIIVGNWIPIGLCGMVGAILGRPTMPLLRRILYSICLFVLGVLAVVDPLIGPKPVTDWQNVREGVVLQSTAASCSAAAAATLLQYTGLEGIEAEMMEYSLTKQSGTSHLGLYRALKLKTADTHFDVAVIHLTPEELVEQNQWPVLLLVGLGRNARVDPRYESERGWTPGVGHAIVAFGPLGPDRFDVGDPATGREEWTMDDLRVLWHGYGLRLVPRKENRE